MFWLLIAIFAVVIVGITVWQDSRRRT